MWYLPRLMVYHADCDIGSDSSELLKVMERRLLKAIINPAMIVTILLGLGLATYYGMWSDGWLHAKILLVLLLSASHGVLAKHVRLFAGDERPRKSSWYRMFNEVPTVLFVLIVILVIFKPF